LSKRCSAFGVLLQTLKFKSLDDSTAKKLSAKMEGDAAAQAHPSNENAYQTAIKTAQELIRKKTKIELQALL
jgi:hypothetical protein